jgi:predicted DNA-binding protein (MmcQ/YjbR family)
MASLKPDQVLERLRRICLALPDAEEYEAWGHPNFRAGKKTFAAFEQYKGEWAICLRVPKTHQSLFLKDPRFYLTPYVGKHGWVSLRVAGRLNWKEIRELVTGSHRLVAG